MGSVAGPSILQTLSTNPEQFLRPATQLHADTLAAAKHFFDPLASGISQEQQAQRKRKRSDSTNVLRLQEIYVDGFTPQQVWEQAQRVLKSCAQVTGRDLTAVKETALSKPQDEESEEDSEEDSPDENEFAEFSEEGSDAEIHEDDLGNMDVDGNEEAEDDVSIAEEDMRSDMYRSDDEGPGRAPTTYQPDRFGLNDGFFSIDEFNKQSAFFEQQDSKNTMDDEDDDEPVNWDADPFAGGMDDNDEDDDEEEDGPVFGEPGDEDDDIDMDGDIPLDDGDEDEEDKGNDRNIRYEDFFDPPAINAKAQNQKQTSKSSKKSESKHTEDLEDEVSRAMSDVRRDLFDDESDEEGFGSDMGSDGAVNLKGLSTHEQRKAKLADEIRKLEAANVAKKDWQVSGEAVAADRPHNALLEEDLEFEHVGKPVPVMTAEITDEIEAMIKQRIIAKEFDDLIRRHPLSLDQGATKKARFELDDSKPQQSLAEIYEADHLKATDPGYVDVKDAKLKKEHDEIRELWSKISSQLDTLSNWHYRPKRPTANINVVQDVATISMEDVRPSGAGGAGTEAMLAPQEVYAPGEDGKRRGEVVLKSGAAIAKDEMTREAKARRRRREKQKLRKAGQAAPKQQGAAAEKQEVISDLKKGGVKVIGKEGRLKDIQGRDVESSAGGKREAFKL